MSKTQSRFGVTVSNNCTPIHLTLTESLGAPGNAIYLSVDGITNVDPAWNDWVWQSTDLYINPKIWTNVQTGGLSYTNGSDDTAIRVIFQRGDCYYFSNVSGFPETLFNINMPYVNVYKDTQTFIEASGYTKLDFAGATITNSSGGTLITNVGADNFAAAVSLNTWEITYSGYAAFEAPLVTPQRINIAAYVAGILVPQSRQTIVVPSGADHQIPFSKTWIQPISILDTFDLRVEAVVGDITVVDSVITLKSLT